MLTRILIILILIFASSSSIFSQELYFCESYSEDGQPVGPTNKLEIRPYGTAIYILLDNKKEFKDPLLYLFVDKLAENKFIPVDSKVIDVENLDNWAVTSYEFSQPGIYEIYFLNSSQTRLASGRITTFFADEYKNQVYIPSARTPADCELIFCEMVINGKPVNQFNSLSLSHTEGEAFLYLNNHIAFGIEKFNVQIWKRSGENSNYEELVDSKKFRIVPEWKDAFFQYSFNSVGEYKIDILDKNNNFIVSNILTVTK